MSRKLLLLLIAGFVVVVTIVVVVRRRNQDQGSATSPAVTQTNKMPRLDTSPPQFPE